MSKPEEWGVTDAGFYCPTYSEIITEKSKNAKMLFGEDIDTGEQTALGKFIRIAAKDAQRLYKQAEQLYYSNFSGTATGQSLDRVCKLAGLTRTPASYARHIVRVYGKNGHTISAATRFKNDSGKIFWSTKAKIIGKMELINDKLLYYADVPVESESAGTSGNVKNINSLVEADSDVTAVEYQYTEELGEAIETDTALRKRFETVSQGLGTNTGSAIISALLKLPYVDDVFIVSNTTTENIVVSDVLTVLPKTYAVIVCADNTAAHTTEIAKTIFSKQPLGIIQSGTTEEVIVDESDESQVVRFSYVRKLNVNVSITCKVSADYDDESDKELQDGICSAINNCGIGNSVIYSSLYKPIYSVKGLEEVEELLLNDKTENITVERDQAANFGELSIRLVRR